jgi:hypothetical protein
VADGDTMSVTRTVPALALRSRLAAPAVTLTGIVALATLLRIALATDRSLPRYLPDEYLYPEIARSLGAGEGVVVLGQPTGFPAILEPILLAPLWASLGSAQAILATQVLHSLLMALAAVPVFLLARRLQLTDGAALACAAATAVAPGLFFAALLTADALGYLLALTAVAAGVRSLAAPTAGTQAVFLVAAGLSTAARLQYAALPLAYLVAAVLTERGLRPTLTRHALVAGTLALGGLAAVLAGSGLLGRWASVTDVRPTGETATWTLSGAFIMAAGAATIVPGAVAWITATVGGRVRERARSGFAALLVALVPVLLVSAALVTSTTNSERFLERYLIVVAPLLVVGFAVWVTERCPARWLAAGIAVILVVAAARVPLVRWTQGQGVADSPTLLALRRVEKVVGPGEAGLIAAAVITLGALAALACALRPGMARIAAGVAAVTLVAISIGAHLGDGATSDLVKRDQFGDDPSWIDRLGVADPLLIQTPQSSNVDAMYTILMNDSIDEAAPLGRRLVVGFDGLATEPVEIDANGLLLAGGRPVTRPVVWALGGTAVVFDGARAFYDRKFALAVPDTAVRVGVVAEGVRYDGKLGQTGRIAVYPAREGQCMRLRATLTVPAGVPPTTLETRSGPDRRVLVVHPDRPATLAVTSLPARRVVLGYRTLRLGNRRPTALDGTVADVRYTAGPVRCAGSQGS